MALLFASIKTIRFGRRAAGLKSFIRTYDDWTRDDIYGVKPEEYDHFHGPDGVIVDGITSYHKVALLFPQPGGGFLTERFRLEGMSSEVRPAIKEIIQRVDDAKNEPVDHWIDDVPHGFSNLQGDLIQKICQQWDVQYQNKPSELNRWEEFSFNTIWVKGLASNVRRAKHQLLSLIPPHRPVYIPNKWLEDIVGKNGERLETTERQNKVWVTLSKEYWIGIGPSYTRLVVEDLFNEASPAQTKGTVLGCVTAQNEIYNMIADFQRVLKQPTLVGEGGELANITIKVPKSQHAFLLDEVKRYRLMRIEAQYAVFIDVPKEDDPSEDIVIRPRTFFYAEGRQQPIRIDKAKEALEQEIGVHSSKIF